ncbi:MAG: hypothetical protein AAGI01_13515, partial [Myxococcota bacterium]
NDELRLSPLPDENSAVSVEECERRLRAMAEQDRLLRQDPTRVTDDPVVERRAVADDNPCVLAAERRGPEQLAPSASEQRARDFAKTRARVLLADGQPGEAWSAVTQGFGERARADEELRVLARSIETEYSMLLAARFATSTTPGRLDDGSAMCLFGTVDEPGKIRMVFEGSKRVVISCALPRDVSSDGRRTLRLVVRKRLAAGRYETIAEIDMGALSGSSKGGAVTQTLDLPRAGVDGPHVLLDVSLRYGSERADALALARGSMAWFDLVEAPSGD